MKRLFESTQNRVLLAVLVGLGIFSVAAPVVEGFTGKPLPTSVSTAVILAALYTVVSLVGSVPEIGRDVRFLREAADVSVQRMSNVTDFYHNLERAVDKATASLDLTHIRKHPPSDFGEGASAFFDRLLDWCSSADGRSIRRVISVRNPAMYEWARQLADETKGYPQFQVRVIEWVTDAPALNMAIVDEKAVYLALTGPTVERTRGLGIEDKTGTAASYFGDYYENLWNCATDLDEWLARNPAEAFADSLR